MQQERKRKEPLSRKRFVRRRIGAETSGYRGARHGLPKALPRIGLGFRRTLTRDLDRVQSRLGLYLPQPARIQPLLGRPARVSRCRRGGCILRRLGAMHHHNRPARVLAGIYTGFFLVGSLLGFRPAQGDQHGSHQQPGQACGKSFGAHRSQFSQM